MQLSHRLVVTENCNASCPHCFNADARNKGMMDADVIMQFMRDNSQYLKDSSLKLMGGEPTLHPRINCIIIEALKHYSVVSLFTNGSRMETISNMFKDRIMYTINGHTFNPDSYSKWVDNVRMVALHFVITKDGAEETVKKIERCMSLPKVRFIYSGDTQVNLFNKDECDKYKKVWMKTKEVLMKKDIPWMSDHRFPLFFGENKMLSGCKCDEVGLIDWNFDLYYCNQTRIKIGSILGKSIPEINEMIKPWYEKKNRAIGCYHNTMVKGENNCETVMS